MSEQWFEPWETRIEELAGTFPYPPTPDIAGAISRRLSPQPGPSHPRPLRWQWVGLTAVILLGLAGLLAVPQVRAAVVEWLQLGAVRIFLVEPTPTASPVPATASPALAPVATPALTPTPLASLLDLSGRVTLAQAQAQVDFPIRLPTEPADFGPPDLVFLQDLQGPAVILVWLDPDDPEQVHLSLHLLGAGTIIEKGQPVVLQETSVNGEPALWVEGPHLLRNRQGDYDMLRLVQGPVLIWTEGDITYRLESDQPLEEARRIAESLR